MKCSPQTSKQRKAHDKTTMCGRTEVGILMKYTSPALQWHVLQWFSLTEHSLWVPLVHLYLLWVHSTHTQAPAQVHINLKSKLIGRICRGSLSLFVLRLHFYLRGEHTNTHKGQIDHESSSQDWSSLHKIYLYSAVGSKQGGCLKARWENFGFFAVFWSLPLMAAELDMSSVANAV